MGVLPDTCHALYCALLRPEFTARSILLTSNEDAYPPGVVTVGHRLTRNAGLPLTELRKPVDGASEGC
ncbi:hypothetical protein AB0K49_04515 [Streptomyces decoyicus]|uniref:hypothetical protein n=1 Tax=Streptomyces decoyicus TaxID=249567 RepID=UPI00345C9F2C